MPISVKFRYLLELRYREKKLSATLVKVPVGHLGWSRTEVDSSQKTRYTLHEKNGNLKVNLILYQLRKYLNRKIRRTWVALRSRSASTHWWNFYFSTFCVITPFFISKILHFLIWEELQEYRAGVRNVVFERKKFSKFKTKKTAGCSEDRENLDQARFTKVWAVFIGIRLVWKNSE